MSKEFKLKKVKGITLISLVITIIILIILASVAIYLSLENNGILERVKQAKKKYINVEQQELEQLNDVYGQMLVATEEDATITISMKQLNDLIDERINKKLYIDTSNVIATIGFDVEYEATEDCIIAGTISSYSQGYVYIFLDGNRMTYVQTYDDNWMRAPVCFQIKKGQKMKVTKTSNNTGIDLKAYSTLK